MPAARQSGSRLLVSPDVLGLVPCPRSLSIGTASPRLSRVMAVCRAAAAGLNIEPGLWSSN